MAAQAGRFGQAGLTRAAEIVSTGLDQMRGATSPRLLLELVCAQVLLPAAAADEKSLLARLERLERGTSAPPLEVPQAPRPAPHSGQDDDAERGRVTSPAERPVPEPARAAARSQQTPPSQPAPARPAQDQAPAEPSGSATAASLRQNWDAILEAVKQERKVAWMLLSHASVLSLEDRVLTLRFPRDGDVKGFSVSGHDAILKRVLNARFGLDVTIKGVAGGDVSPGAAARPPGSAAGGAGAGAARRPVSAPSQSPPAPPEFVPPESVPAESGPAEFAAPYDEPPDDMPPDEMDPDEPSPDDRAVTETALTGMDLIQRELGGQVIGETED
jgi:DNA polymerase-3 subunit gamma/tau